MKFLILLACIAAATAVSYYPYEKDYSYDYYKYPMTEKYYKDYPVYEHDYPWYHKYFKDYPAYEHYGKHYPSYHKDFPVYEKSYKYPYYFKDFPYYNKYYKDYPVHEKYYKDYPVFDKYYKDYPVHEKYYKDFPVHETYFKDFPVHEKYYKDFPMYEKMFKDFNFSEFFGERDSTHVKKDFIIFYYKYLVELIDLFKVRFGDYLTHYETFKYDEFYLPAKCTKITGMFRWMMMMNIDVTTKEAHYFDYYMMCKFVDYIKFIKNYFLHFSVDVMYKDYDLIRGLYGMMGDTGYGIYKYYKEVYGPHFYNYEPHHVPIKYIPGKFLNRELPY